MLGVEGSGNLLREAQQIKRGDGEGGMRRDGEGGKRREKESCFERESACEDVDVASV